MGKKKKKKYEYAKYENIPQNDYDRIIGYLEEMNPDRKKMSKILHRIVDIKNIEKRKVKFVIYEIPIPTSRPRFSRKMNKVYVPNAGDMWKMFKHHVESLDDRPDIIYTGCKMDCKFYLPIPSSMSKSEQLLAEMKFIRPITRPDCDNLGKSMDMLNMNLLFDDAIVYDARYRKYYSFKPRTEITIEYDLEFDCKYSQRAIMNTKRYRVMDNNEMIVRYDGGDISDV